MRIDVVLIIDTIYLDGLPALQTILAVAQKDKMIVQYPF